MGTTAIDFGFTITSDYSVKKELQTGSPARTGTEVVFKITIENTGYTWLSYIPLQDTYQTAYLTYGFANSFATPADSDGHGNTGTINWTDLTAAAPYGFGADLAPVTDLAPGAKFEVFVHFTAFADTTLLGDPYETINTAIVGPVLVDPDGPGLDTVPERAPTPQDPKEASDGVSIFVPTGVEIASFTAAPTDEGVHGGVGDHHRVQHRGLQRPAEGRGRGVRGGEWGDHPGREARLFPGRLVCVPGCRACRRARTPMCFRSSGSMGRARTTRSPRWQRPPAADELQREQGAGQRDSPLPRQPAKLPRSRGGEPVHKQVRRPGGAQTSGVPSLAS